MLGASLRDFSAMEWKKCLHIIFISRVPLQKPIFWGKNISENEQREPENAASKKKTSTNQQFLGGSILTSGSVSRDKVVVPLAGTGTYPKAKLLDFGRYSTKKNRTKSTHLLVVVPFALLDALSADPTPSGIAPCCR